MEIRWTEQEDVDAFLPSIKREAFIFQELFCSNSNSSQNFDIEFDDEGDNFNDEDPGLPVNFYARATFSDLH